VDLKPDDEAVLLRLLPRELAAEVFEYLPLDDQEKTAARAPAASRSRRSSTTFPPTIARRCCRELPAAATQKLLALLSPEEAQDRHRAARLPEKFHRAGA